MRLSFLVLVLSVIGFDGVWSSSLDSSSHMDRSKREDGSALTSDDTEHLKQHHRITYHVGVSSGELTTQEEFFLQGGKGFVYLTNVFNSTFALAYLYAKYRDGQRPYLYRFFNTSSNASELLAQTNAQGQNGYRLKRRLYYRTGNIDVYVKNSRRPGAKYTYRIRPTAQNPEEYLSLANQQGASGYRIWGYGLFSDTTLYVKDTSRKSKFIYKMVLQQNSSAEFLQRANTLGKAGYRFVRFDYVVNPTYPLPEGSPRVWSFSLFSRDKSDSFSKFTYAALTKPTTFPDYSEQLEAQGKLGFAYNGYLSFLVGGEHTIFTNIDQCRCNQVDLDGPF